MLPQTQFSKVALYKYLSPFLVKKNSVIFGSNTVWGFFFVIVKVLFVIVGVLNSESTILLIDSKPGTPFVPVRLILYLTVFSPMYVSASANKSGASTITKVTWSLILVSKRSTSLPSKSVISCWL